uniref:Putative SPFH domain / band 7 protein n=1 Tax=viral metagenome TaxID=1070528 RepID=A0A6M3L1X4_9ZZZZ
MDTLRFLFQQIGKVFTWWVTVLPWQTALRVRLGKHVTVLEAGVHWKVPLVHRVYAQNTRLLYADAPVQTLTTKDRQILAISAVIGYRITDVERLYTSIQQIDATILSLAMGVIAETVSSTDSADCSPARIESAVESKLGKTDWGLQFEYVRCNDFAYCPTLRLIGDYVGNNFSNYADMDRQMKGEPNY